MKSIAPTIDALESSDEPFVLLDDSSSRRKRGALLFTGHKTFEAFGHDDALATLEKLDAVVASGLTVAGYFSYELGEVLQGYPQPINTSTPMAWFLSGRPIYISAAQMDAYASQRARSSSADTRLIFSEPIGLENWFQEAFTDIRERIYSGDVYQVNLTFPLQLSFLDNPICLYWCLRARQRVPYGALVFDGHRYFLSFSPELFLRKCGSMLTAKPMKGTAARAKNPSLDRENREQLLNSSKERAENLMIVDLLRNDLSRVSKCGTVKVPSLFEIEALSSVWQMTSTITSEADEELRPSQLLKAAFPCGSVTGAPKVKAMEIIRGTERGPRGVYCGAIGYFRGTKSNSDWCLNVPIRTLTLDRRGTGVMNVGAGLTASSDCQDEFSECLLKASFAVGSRRIDQPKLKEVFCIPGADRPNLMQEHIRRLSNSAALLDYPLNLDELERQIREVRSLHNAKTAIRLEITLCSAGELSILPTSIIDWDPQTPSPVLVGSHPINTLDPGRKFKSTDRHLYSEALNSAKAYECHDAVLVNSRSEVIGCTSHNIFLRNKQGTWVTPSLESGAFPGIGRRYYMSCNPAVHESRVTIDDLKSSIEVQLVSSARGLIPAMLHFGGT